jgi:hypothetical protein
MLLSSAYGTTSPLSLTNFGKSFMLSKKRNEPKMIPVGYRALFFPSLNWNWGDYYLETLFGIYPPDKI